jgi:hypothetical protein
MIGVTKTPCLPYDKTLRPQSTKNLPGLPGWVVPTDRREEFPSVIHPGILRLQPAANPPDSPSYSGGIGLTDHDDWAPRDKEFPCKPHEENEKHTRSKLGNNRDSGTGK